MSSPSPAEHHRRRLGVPAAGRGEEGLEDAVAEHEEPAARFGDEPDGEVGLALPAAVHLRALVVEHVELLAGAHPQRAILRLVPRVGAGRDHLRLEGLDGRGERHLLAHHALEVLLEADLVDERQPGLLRFAVVVVQDQQVAAVAHALEDELPFRARGEPQHRLAVDRAAELQAVLPRQVEGAGVEFREEAGGAVDHDGPLEDRLGAGHPQELAEPDLDARRGVQVGHGDRIQDADGRGAGVQDERRPRRGEQRRRGPPTARSLHSPAPPPPIITYDP
jgi:hypothetical protein